MQRIVRAMNSTSQAEDGGHVSPTQETIDGPELLSANIQSQFHISKMVERMVDSRLIAYTDRYALAPIYQSAYRCNHSTETALVKLYNDMIHVFDRGEVGALVLLDISAAFDIVDHRIMADVLNRRFDIRGDALAWFVSYFDNRTHGCRWSPSAATHHWHPRFRPGSHRVWFGAKVICHFEFQRVMYHLFADDMQGHVSTKPRNARLI